MIHKFKNWMLRQAQRDNIVILLFFFLFVFSFSVQARSGCCSHHGGVCGCGCCDGTGLSAKCAPYYPECNGGSQPVESVPVYVPPTDTPIPWPTWTPTPRPPTNTPTPRPTSIPTPSPTPTITPTPTVTSTPTITPTFAPTNSPTPKPQVLGVQTKKQEKNKGFFGWIVSLFFH